MLNKLYEGRSRFTGDVVRGFGYKVVEMLGVNVAVVYTGYGEVNCYVDSLKEVEQL